MPAFFKRASFASKLNLGFIALSYAGCFAYGLVGTVSGSLFPDVMKAFQLTNTQGALFFSLASLAGLANNLLTYKWYPRLGAIHGMTVSSILFALGTLMVSLSQSFALVLVGAALIGFAMGANGLLVNILASQSTTDSSLRRRVLSGLHAMYGTASLLAPLLVNALAAGGLGWRMIYLVMGITPLVAAAISSQVKEEGERKTERRTAFLDEKPWRRTIWYASVCMLYVAVETLLTTRLALYARSELGFEMSQANLLLSAFFLMFSLGRVAFTFVRSAHSNSVILVASAMVSFALLLVGLYLHPWALALSGLGFSVFYPCAMALLADEMGAATPFVMTWCQIAQAVGTVVMHELVGWLSDEFGLQRAFLFGPACFIAVLILLTAGNPVFPRQNRSVRADSAI